MSEKVKVNSIITTLATSPKSFKFLVYDANALHPGVVRGVITKDNYQTVAEKINEVFGTQVHIDIYKYLFRIQAEEWAYDLPGITKVVKHPVSGDDISLFNAIISLNDKHKWTREQIADWIESLDEVPKFDLSKNEEAFGYINYSTGESEGTKAKLENYRKIKEISVEW